MRVLQLKVVFFLLCFIPFYSHATMEKFLELPVTNGITAYPSIEVNLRHDDNIFLSDEGLIQLEDGRIVDPVRSSFITEVNPELVLRGRNGLQSWDVAYRGEYGWYDDSSNDNYTDHLFSTNLHLEANSRHRFNTGLKLLYLHEDRGSGISDGAAAGDASVSIDPDTYRDLIIYGDYTFGGEKAKGQVVIDGEYLDRAYTNNRERTTRYDRKEGELGATFYYRLSLKTSLVFLGKVKDINYDLDNYNVLGTLNSTEQRYEAGIRWKTSAKTQGIATIGQTYKDFKSNLRKDTSFTSWKVEALWLPKTYSKIKFLANSRPSESNGTGNFTLNTAYGIDWNHGWSTKTSTHLGALFENKEYEGSLRDDDEIRYRAGIEYKFKNTLEFGLNFEHANRDSNREGLDYDNNQVMFTSRLGM